MFSLMSTFAMLINYFKNKMDPRTEPKRTSKLVFLQLEQKQSKLCKVKTKNGFL